MKKIGIFLIVLVFILDCSKEKKEEKKDEKKKDLVKVEKQIEKKPIEKPKKTEPQIPPETPPQPSLVQREEFKKPEVPLPPQPNLPPSLLPDPRLLLTLDDILRITETKRSFERKNLHGIPETSYYTSLYFAPKENENEFGVSVQLWYEDNEVSLKNKYAQHFQTYPNAVEIKGIGDKTFFAFWGDILYISFFEVKKKLIVTLSCGKNICNSDEIYELGKKVSMRLK